MTVQMHPSIGIFCSSKTEAPKPFLEFAFNFGSFLGKKKFNTICFKNNSAICSALIEGVESNQGFFKAIHSDTAKITQNKLIFENSDVLCFLPGGFNTLNDLLFFIDLNKTINNKKTIIIIDIMNYYSNLLNWFEEISLINMIYPPSELFCIARSMHDLEHFFNLSNSAGQNV